MCAAYFLNLLVHQLHANLRAEPDKKESQVNPDVEKSDVGHKVEPHTEISERVKVPGLHPLKFDHSVSSS